MTTSNKQLEKDIVVSVCINTYNHADYIQQCVISVCEQETDFRFEVIVGDDASTDGTSEILKNLATIYNNLILLIHQKNTGGSHNYIETNKMAKGVFVAYIDGDDYWLQGKLKKQYDFLLNNTSFSGVATQKFNLQKDGQLLKFNNNCKYIDSTNILKIENLPSHCSFMLRNSSRTLLEIAPKDFGNDMMVYLDLAMSGPILILDDYLAVYRDGVGISSNPLMKKIIANSFEKVFEFAIKRGYDLLEVELKKSTVFMNLAYDELNDKNFKEFTRLSDFASAAPRSLPIKFRLLFYLRNSPKIASIILQLNKKIKYLKYK